METLKLIEFEGETPDEIRQRLVPAKDIVLGHRKKWAVPTSLGYVVLRKPTELERQEVSIRLMSDPDYARAQIELQPLTQAMREAERTGTEMSLEDVLRMRKLGVQVAPKQREYMLLAIIEPAWIKTVEDLNGFLDSLPEAEASLLFDTMTEIVRAKPEQRVAGGLLEMARRFNIPLPPDLTLENLTAELADAMRGEMEDEANAVKAAQETIKSYADKRV